MCRILAPRHAPRPALARAAATAALAACAALLAACGGGEPAAERHDEVLVVVNGDSEVSVAIGAYYMERRGIPPENLLRLALPARHADLGDRDAESVNRTVFERDVRDPLAAFLTENGLVDRIESIVLAKGVPLRVRGGRMAHEERLQHATHASVDAELAVLFSGLDGSAGIEGTANPYFDSDLPFRVFRDRHPEAPLRYLVVRLDGYQEPLDPETGIPADVRALVDNATAEGTGTTWLVDEDPDQPRGRSEGNVALLRPAAGALRGLGLTVFHDRLAGLRGDVADIAGYASWGSNDQQTAGKPYYGEVGGRRYPGTFGPRAVAVDIVSTNGRSFVWPPDYGQSLCADLVRLGAAGVAGNVYEPLMSAVARPNVLLRRYAQGVPAGEAYYRSVPYLSWANVWVGDPLMRSAAPATARLSDRDGDGVDDERDRCQDVPDPDQRDTDGDGFGNLCDADFDADGLVGTTWGAFPYGDVDLLILRGRMGHHDDEDFDLNGDGRVDERDLSLARLSLFLPPGPSGLARPGPGGAAGAR